MCCSVSPNVEVKFSDTILYAAEVVNLQGKTAHVLGYQNRAQNNVKNFSVSPVKFWNKLKNIFSSSEKTKGNAMILPFPCVPRTMSKENVLDTEKCPNVLKNIGNAVTPIEPPILSQSLAPRSASVVEIFEAAGIYTVVLAQDARAIPDALDQVPKEKRPKLNPALFDAYAKWYPAWTIALCCFNNEDLQEALPMLWWYEPMFPEKLFLPTLDSHTGSIPSLYSKVRVDHTLAVGSTLIEEKPIKCRMCLTENPSGNSFCKNCGSSLAINEANLQDSHWGMYGPKKGYQFVYYSDGNSISEEVKRYLLPKVMGGVYQKWMPNGDFVCQINEVREGIWNPIRTLPPNA